MLQGLAGGMASPQQHGESPLPTTGTEPADEGSSSAQRTADGDRSRPSTVTVQFGSRECTAKATPAVDTSVEIAGSALTTDPVEASPRMQNSDVGQGAPTAVQRATAAKEAGNGAFKAGDFEAAVAHYKKALRILAADAGPKVFGVGANVLVRPAQGGTGASQKRQRNGGLRYAMVLCDDPRASTVDMEYLPSALAESGGENQVAEEEEDDVTIARCEPLYDSETGAFALQLSLHMNWARCLKAQKRPHDGQLSLTKVFWRRGVLFLTSSLLISLPRKLTWKTAFVPNGNRSKACKCCSGASGSRPGAHSPREQ